MPDLQDFAVAPTGTKSVSVPTFAIAAKLVDSQTGAVLADLTGARALSFPGVLKDLSADDRRELFDLIAHWLLLRRAGLG